MKELQKISSDFYARAKPRFRGFMAMRPSDRDREYFKFKKLSEIAVEVVLFKLDAVKTEGNSEVIEKREALVKEVQAANEWYYSSIR